MDETYAPTCETCPNPLGDDAVLLIFADVMHRYCGPPCASVGIELLRNVKTPSASLT